VIQPIAQPRALKETASMLRRSAPAAVLAAFLIAPSAAPAATGYAGKITGDSTLVGYWRLGETSGTRAAAAKGPNGTYTNGPQLGQTGLIADDANKAVLFDGSNDNVAVSDQSALDLKKFSLEAWIKPSSLPTTKSKTIVGKQNAYWLSITPQNQLRVGFYNGVNSRNATGGTLQAGQRYHVYGSYNGSTLKVCVNGVEKASVQTSTSPQNSTSPVRVGVLSGTGSEAFKGVIDEPAVYNQAGTCATAKSHYDAGNPAPASAPAQPSNPTPPPSSSPPPATSTSTKPAAPSGLTATPGNGTVTLDWNDSADLASDDRYQVYQDNALIADGPATSSYTVSGLTNGRSYAFRVSAGGSSARASADRYGPWTAAVSATPQAPPPAISAPDPADTSGSNDSMVFPKSYFYDRVPASPDVSSNSSNWVNRIVDDGKPEALALNDWQYPQYEASSSDPIYTVSTTRYVGPQGDHRIRIPSSALPAPGGDGNMGVADPAANKYWGFYGVESIDRSARTITARGGGYTALDGNGSLYGESSLGVATKLGVVTPEELDAGHIDHALMVVVACTTGTVNGAGSTRDCASMGKPAGPPNGAHLQLQISDAELAAFPAWKRTILRAMRDYGMYVAETGGGFLKADYAPGSPLATKWQNWLNAHSSDGGVNAGGRSLDVVSGVSWRSRLRVVTP
jgi:hypothetical protein